MSLFDTNAENYFEPVQHNQVKLGKYLMIKGHPCKVTSALLSKPGKHGSSKLNVTGMCLHCNKKYNMGGLPGHATGKMPVIAQFTLELVDVGDEYFSFMLDDGSTYDDVEINSGNEQHQEIVDKFEEAQSKNKSCLVQLTRMPLELKVGDPVLFDKIGFLRLED
jgi:translation initiation factor 5A